MIHGTKNKEVVYQDELTTFNELYYKYNRAVFRNILKMVKEEECAEDILQEVFLTFWDKRDTIDQERVAGWLFVVSYNKSVKFLKERVKISLMESTPSFLHNIEEQSGEDESLLSIRYTVLEEAIANLPQRKKDVLRMCRFEGRSTNEVADLLNISENSVKDYLKQATKFIKKYIHTRYPEMRGTTLLYFIFFISL